MSELVKRLIAIISYEQLRYDEHSYEYQQLASLIQILEGWSRENN